MDAPVGTLLAFATAPGKLAADSGTGSNANSLYATYLAKHLLTPGLPVRERLQAGARGRRQGHAGAAGAVGELVAQGEFSFVPGVAAVAQSAPEQEAAGESAFWNSIQSSNRADEYRAYLRQYPKGRFVALAQMRITAFSAAAPTLAAAPCGSAAATADVGIGVDRRAGHGRDRATGRAAARRGRRGPAAARRRHPGAIGSRTSSASATCS